MSYGSKGVIAESGAGWKRRSTGLLVILGIILFHQVPLFAGNNSNGGTAGAFTRLGFGARSLGMGNAVIACHGFSQLLYENPAAIHGAENPAVDLTFQKLSLDRRLLGLSALLPLPPSGALAVEVLQSGVGDLPEITFEGEETGRTFDYRENLYALGFALSPASFLSFGISLNIFSASFLGLAEDDGAFGEKTVGLNLGVQVQPLRDLTLGGVARNLNAGYNWNGSEVWGREGDASSRDDLPRTYGVGASYALLKDALLLEMDYVVSDQKAWDVNLGAAYRLFSNSDYKVVLRSGRFEEAVTAGLGLSFRVRGYVLGLDYAVRFPRYDPQGVHLFTWSFRR